MNRTVGSQRAFVADWKDVIVDYRAERNTLHWDEITASIKRAYYGSDLAQQPPDSHVQKAGAPGPSPQYSLEREQPI